MGVDGEVKEVGFLVRSGWSGVELWWNGGKWDGLSNERVHSGLGGGLGTQLFRGKTKVSTS
jgi:hypothetical protein